MLRALSTPGLLAEAEAALGPYPVNADYTVADDKRRAAFAIRLLETKKPDLLLAYLGGLDEEEHQNGPYSPKALAALEELDGLVGQLWQAALRVGEGKAVFLVVSDHGFAPLEKEVYLNALLRQEGFIAVDGEGKAISWKACLWNGLGCGALMFSPSATPEDRAAAIRFIQDLARDPEVGIDHLEMGPGTERGGFPEAALVIYMKPGYALYTDLGPGPLVRPAEDRGTHGYSPELSEMNACFLAHGPGLPAGLDLGFIDARAVAPTVAAFLGLGMPSAEVPPLFSK
jgi:predicted AlkP superfamily pyrophosphatase or phosphodiesterase